MKYSIGGTYPTLFIAFIKWMLILCVFGFGVCFGLLHLKKDKHSVIFHVSWIPHFSFFFFHIFHDSITRTPEELQRAMIYNAPWSRSKHRRFDPQFRSLVFELLCMQQLLAIPMDDMESIQLAWSMVRKFKLGIC